MRVIMSATLSGTRDGADWPTAGEVIDVPDLEAADLIAAGYAVIESGVAAPPESAAMAKPRKR